MSLPLRSTSGMTSRRSTRVSRVVKASRERVYSALLDANEVARWRFPTGMSIVVDQFEPREGGQVRVSLTYASSGVGKTKDRDGHVHGSLRRARAQRARRRDRRVRDR